MPDLYQMLRDAGCETDNHESDLYVKDTETARRVIAEYEQATGKRVNKETFRSQIDKTAWFDIPFQYTPFWERKLGSGSCRECGMDLDADAAAAQRMTEGRTGITGAGGETATATPTHH